MCISCIVHQVVMLHYKYKQILGFLEGNNVTSMSFSVSKNNIIVQKNQGMKKYKMKRYDSCNDVI